MDRKKICFIVAVPGTAKSFLRDHIEKLSETYDVYLAGNIKKVEDVALLKVKGWQHIDIQRKISILTDLKALKQLTSYFWKMKFDAVHSVTPKAGLLTSMAGFLAGIKYRIHIFTGQVWATRSGFNRTLLKSIDKLIACMNTNILVDGESQRQFLIKNNVLTEKKSHVLGDGSICGVNTTRFQPCDATRALARSELGMREEMLVFVFMGRLNRDKGIYELLEAFNKLSEQYKNIFLLIFGSDEEHVADNFGNYNNLKEKVNVLYYGSTREPEKMLQAGDFFVLPTYREGFGTSVIEAQCLGLPVITSDAYGVVDASVEGETGLRCKVGDTESLYKAMEEFVLHADKAKEMGKKGRERVLEKFSGERVVAEWNNYYSSLFDKTK